MLFYRITLRQAQGDILLLNTLLFNKLNVTAAGPGVYRVMLSLSKHGLETPFLSIPQGELS